MRLSWLAGARRTIGDRRSGGAENIKRRSSHVLGILIATIPACSRHMSSVLRWMVTRLILSGDGRLVLPRAAHTMHGWVDADDKGRSAMTSTLQHAQRWANFSVLATRRSIHSITRSSGRVPDRRPSC